MLSPIKFIDLEVSQPLSPLEDLGAYQRLQGLVRLHGAPLGYIDVPIINGGCSQSQLSQAILDKFCWAICQQLLQRRLLAAGPMSSLGEGFSVADLLHLPSPEFEGEPPLVTVAVCTRDRPEALERCLAGLLELDYPNLDILVVDNAPATEETRELIANYDSQVRYVCEPRPGLDWARNRALIEARGEIIAYTDDDVVVDRGWVKAIAKTFQDSPTIMAVTGLVVPYELETDAQILFEMQGGFGKGFERQRYRIPTDQKTPWYLVGTGNFGTGANMAFRRSLFAEVGGFNPALDVGTVTNGAGDLEMFFRVIKAGHELVYEPGAMVRHQHRSSYAELKTQLFNNGSVLAYCASARQAYPEDRQAVWRLALTWLVTWHCRRLISGLMHPKQFPLDLVWAELKGWFRGLNRYGHAYETALAIAEQFATDPAAEQHRNTLPHYFKGQSLSDKSLSSSIKSGAIAVREIDLQHPLQDLTDVLDYGRVRLFISQAGQGLGYVDIDNHYQPIGRLELAQKISQTFWHKLFWSQECLSSEDCYRRIYASLSAYFRLEKFDKAVLKTLEMGLFEMQQPQRLGSVSIIIGTHDRPEDLQNCLTSLLRQPNADQLEIIVVDNNPDSGLTPPVVAAFPQVRLIKESRKGVAYARNAGISASQGEIIVTTDDDVTMMSGWLEQLLAPFSCADVMAVTGNILPIELETESQQLFEYYGGLGRGFDNLEVGQLWFERSAIHAVPTWELGGTANAAFRASLFRSVEIGLMEESLGPGMPSGVGEDIYLFYKILKAGYNIAYQGNACVWHRHRQTMPALRHQLYNYSKGFVSYHLTTLIQDRDLRVLFNLFFYLPMYHAKRIYQRLRRRSPYPIGWVGLEIMGNLAGPWSLWQSHRRVKREGRSEFYRSSHL